VKTENKKDATNQQENPENSNSKEYFKQALKQSPEGIDAIVSLKQQPISNQQHAKTLEKNYPKNRNKEDEMFDDESNFIHNTTGDKDRKRRKTLGKTLVLSASKMFQPGSNENACP